MTDEWSCVSAPLPEFGVIIFYFSLSKNLSSVGLLWCSCSRLLFFWDCLVFLIIEFWVFFYALGTQTLSLSDMVCKYLLLNIWFEQTVHKSIWTANKPMKRYSPSSVIMEMQIKSKWDSTTYLLEWLKFKKTTIVSISNFSKGKIPYLWSDYSTLGEKEIYGHLDIMFLTALFPIAKTDITQCPLIGKWINKWYIYMMEYYMEIKRNKFLIHATAWMNLKLYQMKENRTPPKRSIYFVIPFIWSSSNINWFIVIESRPLVAWGEGGRWRREFTRGHEHTLWVMDMFTTLIVLMASWAFTYAKSHQSIHTKYV